MADPARNGIAIVVLAGGAATRLPHKLEREIAPGEPLLERVLRNFDGVRYSRYVCAGDDAEPAFLSERDVRVLRDRTPHAGPLAALVSACENLGEDLVFAVAGDAPRVGAAVLEELMRARRDGDEAVVPVHGATLEPLAALYARTALIRAGRLAMESGAASMHAALERMNVRAHPMHGELFINVNTPDDLRKARAGALMETL